MVMSRLFTPSGNVLRIVLAIADNAPLDAIRYCERGSVIDVHPFAVRSDGIPTVAVAKCGKALADWSE